MESDSRDIVCVAIELEHGVRVGGFDVVEPDAGVACCREETLIRGYTETVYLTIGVLNRS